MPVLLTGATGMVGRALAQRLVSEGGQVRAYVRRDDEGLRAAGVHVAVGDSLDVGRLEAALTRVHTIVHLVGGWWPARDESYDFLNRETTEAAVVAARAADCRRILFLSFPGADPGSPNEFLAAKGEAEEHVRRSGLEHAIFRCTPIVGPGSQIGRALERMRRGPLLALPGPGTQRLNPLALTDVVEALAAADGREDGPAGTWELGGPEEITLDGLADRILGPRRKTHAGRLRRGPRALLDLLSVDCLADPAEAVARFGLPQRLAGS